MTNIYRLEEAGLWFLPAGEPLENPLELMQSGRLAGLMDQLTAWFDWILIDSPPVLPLADTSVWSRVCRWRSVGGPGRYEQEAGVAARAAGIGTVAITRSRAQQLSTDGRE